MSLVRSMNLPNMFWIKTRTQAMMNTLRGIINKVDQRFTPHIQNDFFAPDFFIPKEILIFTLKITD